MLPPPQPWGQQAVSLLGRGRERAEGLCPPGVNRGSLSAQRGPDPRHDWKNKGGVHAAKEREGRQGGAEGRREPSPV